MEKPRSKGKDSVEFAPDTFQGANRLLGRSMLRWWLRIGWPLLVPYILIASLPPLHFLQAYFTPAGVSQQEFSTLISKLSILVSFLPGLVWALAVTAVEKRWLKMLDTNAVPHWHLNPAVRFRLFLQQGWPIIIATGIVGLAFASQGVVPALTFLFTAGPSGYQGSSYQWASLVFYSIEHPVAELYIPVIFCLLAAVNLGCGRVWIWLEAARGAAVVISFLIPDSNNYFPVQEATWWKALWTIAGVLTLLWLAWAASRGPARLAVIVLTCLGLLGFPVSWLGTWLTPRFYSWFSSAWGRVTSPFHLFGPAFRTEYDTIDSNYSGGNDLDIVFWAPFENWHFVSEQWVVLPVLAARILLLYLFCRLLLFLAAGAKLRLASGVIKSREEPALSDK